MTARRLALSALLAAALVAGAAGPALGQGADSRTNAAPLGAVTMARAASPDASGAAALQADVTLNASVAKDAGAVWILVSVGNDANTALVVEPGTITRADGTSLAASRVDNAGTYRVNWWFEASGFSSTETFTLTATANPGSTTTDVETLVMAFDSKYNALSGDDGRELVVQSFTTVAAGAAPEPVDPTPGDGGQYQGPGDEPPLVDPNAPDDTPETPKKRNPVPGPALALVAAAVALAGVALGRRVR